MCNCWWGVVGFDVRILNNPLTNLPHCKTLSVGILPTASCMSWFSLWCPISRFDAYTSDSRPNTYLYPNNAQSLVIHHLTYVYHLTHPLHMTPLQWVILYPSLLMADTTENPRNLSTFPIGSSYTAYPLVLRYTYLLTRHWLITIPMYYLSFRSVPIGR